jgi:heat shock protein HslJ
VTETIVNKRLASAVVLIAAAACSRGAPLDDPMAAPSAFELSSATYSGILNEPITLSGGRWEGEPYVEGGASRPTVGLVDHFILTGDLDGDGLDEAVVLLLESSGGSGTRLFLAAIARGDDSVTNLSTLLIGDRVQVRSGAIDGGKITLDVVRAGPEDAACCPTEKALVTWALTAEGLTQMDDETIGTLSLADLGGHEWVLVELGRDQYLPEDVEITLLVQDERVSGSSGCNKYFAGVLAPTAGEFAFNGMGATRMACPEPEMDLERRYLQALAGASDYRFLGGRLVLSCETDEGSVALVYRPRTDG